MDPINLVGVLLLVISDSLVNCEKRWSGRTWQTNINYNNSYNWNVGRIPCDTDRIVLQRSESIVLQLPEGKNSFRELVLPTYTELVLPKNGLIQFTGLKKSPNCEGQDVIFKPVRPSKWIDPDNWDGWNSATPDIERIPCVSDSVRFPAGSTYKVIMPDYVKFGSLEVNGVPMDTLEYTYALESYGGVNPFQTADGNEANNIELSGYTCDKTRWCECGNEYLRSQICLKVPCSEPRCQQPVQPHGFCCPLCGVYFLLESTSVKKQQLTDHLNSFLRGRAISWHASKVGDNIQVVLVEDEYTGELPDVAESLKTSLAASGFKWIAKEFHTSGHILYPVTFGQVVGHFFSLMIASALILAAIIVFYSHNWSWLAFSPLEGRPFVFARFENQSGEVVVASEERQPSAFQPQTFDNPMYDATKQDQGSITVESPIYTELEGSPNKDSFEDLTDIAE